MSTHVGIEPGDGLIGRFGDTVILIHRGAGPASDADEVAGELRPGRRGRLDPERPVNMIATRLATWVIGRMATDVTAFGIVVPVRDGAVMFLRGAVCCEVTQNGSTRQMSGAQALSWVDQIIPAPFERLAIGGAPGRLRCGVSVVRPPGRGGARAGLRADPRGGQPPRTGGQPPGIIRLLARNHPLTREESSASTARSQPSAAREPAAYCEEPAVYREELCRGPPADGRPLPPGTGGEPRANGRVRCPHRRARPPRRLLRNQPLRRH